MRMDATRRTLTLRRVATMAALAALTPPAGPAEAAKGKVKPPVITKVTPMKATVGQWLTINGRNFRRGKGRNSVGFKRDGAAVVFARSDISTAKMLKVRVPAKLEDLLAMDGTRTVATRFRLRILTSRFGKAFTPARTSPLISSRPPKGTDGPGPGPVTPPPAAPEGNCDGDGQLNGADTDDDNDLVSDAFENSIGTDGCDADSDDDKITDGYEYRSAVDLNDDEYAQPNTAVPYPGKRPYPNPLNGQDATLDFDGDGLTLLEEFRLWQHTTPNPAGNPFADVPGRATPLSYSDGLQYSESVRCEEATGASAALCQPGRDGGRRVPMLPAANYGKWQDFIAWATPAHIRIDLHTTSDWYDHFGGRHEFDIRDTDLSGDPVEPEERFTLDADLDDWLSDDERDEDADGLTNYDELKSRMQPVFWEGCYEKEPLYPVRYAGTDALDADTDGDGVRDGADDQDNDDFPNLMELSRFAASSYQYNVINETDDRISGAITRTRIDVCVPDPDLKPDEDVHPGAYGQVNPFNPCLPDRRARSCADKFVFGQDKWAPFGGPRWWALN